MKTWNRGGKGTARITVKGRSGMERDGRKQKGYTYRDEYCKCGGRYVKLRCGLMECNICSDRYLSWEKDDI